jgi:hypothetical protein
MSRLSEQIHPFALTESADVTTNGVDSKSVNMGLFHAGMWQLNFGAITSDDVLKVYVGAATATKTTAIAFKYRLAGADTKAAGSDTLGAFTDVTSSGLTLAATTFDHRFVTVEIDSQAIPDATPYVTLEIAGSATTQNVSITFAGIPRFKSNSGTPTVL